MQIESPLELSEIARLRMLDTESLAEELIVKRNTNMFKDLFGELPIEQVQSQFTGLSQKQTFLQALTYLDLCAKTSENVGQPFERNGDKLIVDFGCGWGRITQLLSLYFNPHRILGCDVMSTALVEAKQNHVRGKFAKVENWPPSQVADASVSYIFSYSVFSHLNEDNAFAWIREFHRILIPGGIAFLTTRHSSFFDYLHMLHKSADVPGFAAGAYKAFRNIESARKEYETGRFCFDAQGSGGEGLTPIYGEAFIPSKYVSDIYGQMFAAVGFEDPVPAGLLDQATFWLRK